MKRIIWPALALMTLTLGCGDDGESGPLFSSGMEAEKRVKDLTEAEVDGICEGIEVASAKLVSTERMCLFMGLMFSEDAASCEQLKQMCVQGGEDPFASEGGEGGEEPEEPACALKGKTADCEATMEEFDGCVDFTMVEVQKYINSLSCSMVTELQAQAAQSEEGAAEPPAEQEMPAQCKPLADKCPALLEGMSGQTSPENQLGAPQDQGGASCSDDAGCGQNQACVSGACQATGG